MKSDNQNNATLTSIFDAANYFALLKSAPVRSQTGATWPEVTTSDHGSYARVVVGTKMASPANGDVANDEAITFPQGSSGAPAKAYFVGVADASSNGNAKAAYPIHGGNAQKPVVSITRSGGTATVTCTGHGFTTGDEVYISGATLDAYNIVATITVTDANTFTYAVSGSPATPAVAEFGAIKVQKLAPVIIGATAIPTVAIAALAVSER